MLPIDENGLVITPHGRVPASEVIQISANEIIGISNGHLVAEDRQSGLSVADYGEVSQEALRADPRAWATRLRREHLRKFGVSDDSLDSKYPGYYTFAAANYIQYFKTTWVVPDLPTDQVNKTFFIWNGLDGGALQPILQWGNGHVGYQIANWAFLGKYICGTYLSVKPGDVLVGTISYVERASDSFTFLESFGADYSAADFTVKRPNDATSACQCFESYTDDPNQWPASTYTAMKDIKLQRRQGAFPMATLGWQISTSNAPPKTQSGQTTVIASDSAHAGEVDFYFH